MNRNTRRLQTNQKDFKQMNSSHMTYIYRNENGKETHTKTNITYEL